MYRFVITVSFILGLPTGCLKKSDQGGGDAPDAAERSVESDNRFGEAHPFAGTTYRRSQACETATAATTRVCYDEILFQTTDTGILSTPQGQLPFRFSYRAGALTIRSDKVLPTRSAESAAATSGQVIMILRSVGGNNSLLADETGAQFQQQAASTISAPSSAGTP